MAMVASINRGHFRSLTFAHWAHASLGINVHLAVIAVVGDYSGSLLHVHLAHGAFSGLHRRHVAVGTHVDLLGLAHRRLSLLRKDGGEGEEDDHKDRESLYEFHGVP